MSNLILTTDLTVTAGAYAANDSIGGLQSVEAGRVEAPSDKVVHSITITDKAQQKAALNIIIFKENPDDAGTTITNDAGIDIADDDLNKVIGVVEITASDYIDFTDNSVACVTAIGLPIDSSVSTFYWTVQAVGTPTYASTSDVSVTIGML